MKLAAKIAVAALAGLGIAAIDAHAQGNLGGPGGPGMPGGPGPAPEVSPLTADQIKTVVQGRLIMKRSDLSVGKVAERDAETFSIELVKPDGTVSEVTVVDKRFAHPAGALDGMGPKGPKGMHMRGPGGDGPMCGDGERSPGPGPGERGYGPDHGKHAGMFGQERTKPLTAVQVKDIIEGRIAMRGEDYKVGKVSEKDANTWQAEVLGADGKVVHTILVDKKSGRFMPQRG